MVQQDQTHQLERQLCPAGQLKVRLPGMGIAGGMVVDEDDGIGFLFERQAYEGGNIQRRLGHAAAGEKLFTDDMFGAIEKNRPALLVIQSAQPRKHVPEHGVRTHDGLIRPCHVLQEQPLPQLQRRLQGNGFGRSYAVDFADFLHRHAIQPGQGAPGLRQQLSCHLHGTGLSCACTDQDGQQFRQRQDLCPELLRFLPRPFVGVHLRYLHTLFLPNIISPAEISVGT